MASDLESATATARAWVREVRVAMAGTYLGQARMASDIRRAITVPMRNIRQEARKAKFQGVVVLQVIVSRDGRATNIQVVKGPGLGLEEQAIAAVQTWRFKPALGPNHLPVATEIDVEVNFRLL